MSFDFYMDHTNMQPFETPLDINITRTGNCNAIAFWFELQLDEQTVISSGPNECNVGCFHLLLQSRSLI